MAEKRKSSESEKDRDVFVTALGKVEQYKLLASIHLKVCQENRDLEKKLSDLEKKLSDLEKSGSKDSSGAPSQTRLSRSSSITQQILDEATTHQLDHPIELYQVMEKEKNEEIEFLRKKSQDAQRDLEIVQHETDKLRGQIQQLMSAMTEKDGRMRELEQRFQEALTEEERQKHLEREQILRDIAHKGASSSWVVVCPSKAPIKTPTIEKEDDETPGTLQLRRKIDELQQRITELLNHNEKWNALCQELQEELDRVRGQLLQYQKAQGFAEHSLSEDLKFETKRRKDAEEISMKARKQVEELEAKVANLEKLLEDKELQEKQLIMVQEELREKASLYEEQIRSYKEDFENEQRDHNVTRSQLDSLRNQWITIYRDVQHKNQQLTELSQRLELLERNNEELQRQLDQAQRDAQLIRHHQKQQQQHTEIPLTVKLSSWECLRCTYRNEEATIVCLMCAASRHHVQGEQPSASRGHTSHGTADLSNIYDPRSFGQAPRFGELEEDGISCY